MSHSPLERDADVVSVDLVDTMGADNDVKYEPTPETWVALVSAIKTFLQHNPSFRFTQPIIEDLACGEEGERNHKYGKLVGYKELSDTLDFIFNNSPQSQEA